MTEKIKRHYIFGAIVSLLVLGIGFAVSTQETKAQLGTVTEGSLTCKVYDEPIEDGVTFAGNAACTNTDGTTGCFMVCGFTNDAKITCAKGYEPIKWTDGWRCAKAGTQDSAIAGVTSYTYGTIKTASSSLSTPAPPTTTTKTTTPPPAPSTTTSKTCEKNIWDCTDWGTCSSSGIQVRFCKLTTYCDSDITTKKPSETQTCKTTATTTSKTDTATNKVGLTTPVKDTKLETPVNKKTEEKKIIIDTTKKEDELIEELKAALKKEKLKEEKPSVLEKITEKVTDKVTEKKLESLQDLRDLRPVDEVLKEMVCADITEKTKNHAEIMEFLKLMHKSGTYLPPKDQKCKPTVKTKWSVAVQMALTLADESCGLDVSTMPSNTANVNILRNACMTRALELGLIEKKKQGNISKVEFYELMMRGANLASVDNSKLQKISYPDIDADSSHYDTVAQAKFYELVKTYKKKGKPGYILPKQPFMLKDALHIAWKALKKSPILHP